MENRIRTTVSQPVTAAGILGQEDSRKVVQSAINLCWHVCFLFRPYLHYLFTPSVLQIEHNFNTFFVRPQTRSEPVDANSNLDFLPETDRVPLVCRLQRLDDTAQWTVQENPQRVFTFYSFILISHSFTIVLCYSDVCMTSYTFHCEASFWYRLIYLLNLKFFAKNITCWVVLSMDPSQIH